MLGTMSHQHHSSSSYDTHESLLDAYSHSDPDEGVEDRLCPGCKLSAVNENGGLVVAFGYVPSLISLVPYDLIVRQANLSSMSIVSNVPNVGTKLPPTQTCSCFLMARPSAPTAHTAVMYATYRF